MNQRTTALARLEHFNMNPQPSAEAIALAESILAGFAINSVLRPDLILAVADQIDRELQLPQRNAALLLAQGVVDTWNIRGYPDNGELLQLRDALAAIKPI